MKIAVLFDGGGLARLGLELAGHDCIGFELDPLKHYLSKYVGSGNCILADATLIDLTDFDAVWASPPCQERSKCRTEGPVKGNFAKDHLDYCLSISAQILWVENVINFTLKEFQAGFGQLYNAAQFLATPLQNRVRLIEGNFRKPYTYRGFKYREKDICPSITATEYKGCASDGRRASRYYGRKLTLEECAYHQGFTIPHSWYPPPLGMNRYKWYQVLYEAIGNGVPVYMAQAFGAAYVTDNKTY